MNVRSSALEEVRNIACVVMSIDALVCCAIRNVRLYVSAHLHKFVATNLST